MRTRLAVLGVVLASLVFAGTAHASWQAATGSGSAYSKARTAAAGSTPSASVSNRSVTVNWTAAGGTVPLDGYVVRRFDSGGTEAAVGAACSGIVNALSCTEANLAPGNWRYTVTPARGDWRGAQSAQSTAVTVASPSLALNTTSFNTLSATTTGQIQSFKQGQTVAFRLDDPSTGTPLTGSITPSPVPANGTASVSVTVPSGIANGSHTVYAVGSNGDQASAAVTVNTGSGFFATGSYTGNSTDNRTISGLGFNPQVVIVKATTAQFGIIRTDTMAGDNSKPMSGSTALGADRIQSLDANGFTLGTNAQVNANTVSYRWMAFRAVNGVLRTGTYQGNGTSQSQAGLGFSPEQVGVFSAGANTPQQRYTGMTRSFGYASDTGITDGITSLDAGGFGVGASANVNGSGTTYHYVAFNDTAGLVEIGNYTGNGADNRNITGVGVSPAYVAVRAADTTTARLGAHRPSSLAGDSTLRYDAVAAAANAIQALQTDGFQLGTDASVNSNGTAYHYMAIRNGTPSPGCASPGSTTVSAGADAWVDQGAPNANSGAGTDLQVRSTLLANRRALLKFALPAIPAGCSLSQATLKLFATSAAASRTIDVYRAASAWTEGGVTWNNAPATTGTAASATSATGTVGWDVTAQTALLYSGADNGFIVRDATESSAVSMLQAYQAREGATAAQDPALFIAWN